MKEINFNLGNEIRIHNLGLAKLEAEQRPIPINVVELSKRISELCKKKRGFILGNARSSRFSR